MTRTDRICRGIVRSTFSVLAALLISQAQYEPNPWWSFWMCWIAIGVLGWGGVFKIGMMEED